MHQSAIALAALVLSSCGRAEPAPNGAAANPMNVASQGIAPRASEGASGDSEALEPGLWEKTDESAPQHGVGPTRLFSRLCLSEEDARQQSLGFTGNRSPHGSDCTKDATFSNGHLHAIVICNGPRAGRVVAILDGMLGRTAYDLHERTIVSSNYGDVTLEHHITGRRVGGCRFGNVVAGRRHGLVADRSPAIVGR